MKNQKNNNFLRRQQGLTLIEVLVSMIILATGILGMMALQTTSLQTNQSSYYRTQAIILAYDIIDRMKANPNAMSQALYNGFDSDSPPSEPSCMTTGCNASDRASLDMAQWAENFDDDTGLLPEGQGTITLETDATYTITVSWQETDWDDSDTSRKTLESKSISIVARPHFQ